MNRSKKKLPWQKNSQAFAKRRGKPSCLIQCLSRRKTKSPKLARVNSSSGENGRNASLNRITQVTF